jgi:hypothetical protein
LFADGSGELRAQTRIAAISDAAAGGGGTGWAGSAWRSSRATSALLAAAEELADSGTARREPLAGISRRRGGARRSRAAVAAAVADRGRRVPAGHAAMAWVLPRWEARGYSLASRRSRAARGRAAAAAQPVQPTGP